MQIFVKTLVDTRTLEVGPNATIDDIRTQADAVDGYMMYGGKPLQSGVALSEYNVQQESTITQVLTLPGGHCQVPCGIFDDPKLVAEVKEYAATIRKAIVQINELHAKTDAQSFNQKTRWVMTKEEHCKNVITAMSEYCLCQRVKPVGAPGSPFTEEKDFIDALKSHHSVMVCAMKAKQTVDIAGADALDHAIADWCKMYLP
jgi:small subunit ribosomal protein S27Ae